MLSNYFIGSFLYGEDKTSDKSTYVETQEELNEVLKQLLNDPKSYESLDNLYNELLEALKPSKEGLRPNVNLKLDKDENSPLHRLSSFKNSKLISLLLQAGADPTLTNKNGYTPAEPAVMSGNIENLEILIKNRSKDDIRKMLGSTANGGGSMLAGVAERMTLSSKILQRLIDLGADYRTPLHIKILLEKIFNGFKEATSNHSGGDTFSKHFNTQKEKLTLILQLLPNHELPIQACDTVVVFIYFKDDFWEQLKRYVGVESSTFKEMLIKAALPSCAFQMLKAAVEREVQRPNSTPDSVIKIIENPCFKTEIESRFGGSFPKELLHDVTDAVTLLSLKNMTDSERSDTVRSAAQNGNLPMVKSLLGGMDSHFQKYAVERSYLDAIQMGHDDVVKYFVEEKKDYVDIQQLVPAARNGHFKIVEYLLKKGANPTLGGSEALHAASSNGYIEIVKLLVQNGARPTAGNSKALIGAANGGHLEIVKYLLSLKKGQRADSRAQESHALVEAAENGHLEIVKELKEAGSNNFPTALTRAAENGHLAIVEYLLENHHFSNSDLSWAAQAAYNNHHTPIEKLLNNAEKK